jgi:hypothetical protein
MSVSDKPVPPGNEPPRLTIRSRILELLAIAGMPLTLGMFLLVGALAGKAITGTLSGAVAGGGIGWLLLFLVAQRVLLKDTLVECGCYVVLLTVLIVVAYSYAKQFEERTGQLRSGSVSAPS